MQLINWMVLKIKKGNTNLRYFHWYELSCGVVKPHHTFASLQRNILRFESCNRGEKKFFGSNPADGSLKM